MSKRHFSGNISSRQTLCEQSLTWGMMQEGVKACSNPYQVYNFNSDRKHEEMMRCGTGYYIIFTDIHFCLLHII